MPDFVTLSREQNQEYLMPSNFAERVRILQNFINP